ncbi:MAG: hypothetical protein ACP5OP_02115 [Leptospirillia bacterium]
MVPSTELSEQTSPIHGLALLGKRLKAITRAIGEILSGPGSMGRIAP